MATAGARSRPRWAPEAAGGTGGAKVLLVLAVKPPSSSTRHLPPPRSPEDCGARPRAPDTTAEATVTRERRRRCARDTGPYPSSAASLATASPFRRPRWRVPGTRRAGAAAAASRAEEACKNPGTSRNPRPGKTRYHVAALGDGDVQLIRSSKKSPPVPSARRFPIGFFGTCLEAASLEKSRRGAGRWQAAARGSREPLGAVSSGNRQRRSPNGDGCGHTVLTPRGGTLSSKNYPGTYPNHTGCRWRLRAPPGASLVLAFGDVDLEPSEGCAAGSLRLLADAGAAYGPYCRNAGPAAPLLVTNASAVTVLFNSTSHRSGRGLLLSYATSQHPDLVSCLVKGTHYAQEHISVYCPAGCKGIAGDIWGNVHQGYRDTSVLCKAAVHAGAIADELGGQVAVTREKGVTLYEAAFANGLRSKRGSLSEKRLVFHRACGDALAVAAFNASSSWHEVDALGQLRAWTAERAELGAAGRSWAAAPGSEAAWLELDLGARRNVTGIITKGSSEEYDYYVESYRVSSSRDGKNWRTYKGSGGQEDKVFEGNADSREEVANAFIPPVVARYVRITPQRWHQRIALKVALLGCQPARMRAPRPYAPSAPKEVPVPPGSLATRTPVPGVALDPEKAGSALLVMLLVGGFVLLCSGLLLLAFLCHRKRKPAAELHCGLAEGHPTPEPSLPPAGSALASFPAPPDLGADPSAEYAEPDMLQASPGGQTGPSTFKPPPDEGYALPLVASHYDVPGKHHEYAEPLPPEPEYATPFSEQAPEPAGTPSRSGCLGSARYHSPAPRPAEAPGGLCAPPRPERTASPGGDSVAGAPAPSPRGSHFQLADCALSHVYHEPL
ncbi:discoidin, CUB and LCCL domain-containing protein 1-like [Rhea pennata]|uniref:discoidin, CUB and LCCL domain-containing protein 1-like n=1 Tax=Rhea pennata TaxID=8795 RepID=UPI002E25FA4B